MHRGGSIGCYLMPDFRVVIRGLQLQQKTHRSTSLFGFVVISREVLDLERNGDQQRVLRLISR